MGNGKGGHDGGNTEQKNGDRKTHSIIELGCLRTLQSSVKVNKGTSRKDCNLRQVLTVKYTKVIIISAKSFKLEEG